MKFVVAVVMLAVAVGVQSSLVAQHAPGVTYVAPHPAGAWGGHLGLPLGHWGGHAAVDHSGWAGHLGGHAAVDHSGWAGPWGGPLAGHGLWGGHAIPGIALAQGPGHAGLGLAHGAHGAGVYVAKTRGAVHTAPLAGHIASATSVNVAPAPGTH